MQNTPVPKLLTSMSPAEFKKFILYFKLDDPNSVMAVNMAKRMPNDVWMTDVQTLKPGERPSWLNGVPILLENDTQTIYRGVKCLERLQVAAATSLDSFSTGSNMGYSSFEMDNPFAPTMASLYDQNQTRRVDQSDLESLMRMRTKQDDYRRKPQGAS